MTASADDNRNLITQLWQLPVEEATGVSNALLSKTVDVQELYQLLKTGPVYRADVPLGRQLLSRISTDGTEFPFMVWIPESYDPNQSWAVDFVLHGGVSRPKPAPGNNFWQRSFDRIAPDDPTDRIIVMPSSWQESFWWQESQADNLPAILRQLKQTYNIDENRVTLTGISDGGTGAYFFAFKQPTEWAAFFPYIAHPGVLRNPQSGGGYRLYFENLMTKPLYIVNGENDPLYPASSLDSFIAILEDEAVHYRFRAIPEGEHNLRWFPFELEAIEKFKTEHPRDPFPDSLQWVADRTDRYNRLHWIKINAISAANNPSLLKVDRRGNHFTVDARGVSRFTMLLNPEEVDFEKKLSVEINGELRACAKII
ncbi:MAG: hypothetical protein OXE78_10860 [Gammaproteobacteria bacterium]|nr:hypothetical protein [Gammaproteobacteria bacterium]